MSAQLEIVDGDDVDVYDLAPAGAMVKFNEWVSASEGWKQLEKLVETGTCKNTKMLATELVAALEDTPDPSGVAERLVQILGTGDPRESVRITI